MKGSLYIVATPIGNLKDISENANYYLNNVDLIAAEDTRNSKVLLNYIDSNVKMVAYHKFNEEVQSNKIIEKLLEGKNVALITDAGTPCISDPGSILVKKAIDNQINVVSIPGPSAMICALTLSGFDITSFSFYGFLPRETGKLEQKLNEIRNDNTKVVVLYESPKRIENLLKSVINILNDPDVCLCNELTKKFEKKYYGKASEVLKTISSSNVSSLGEYVLVINKNSDIEEIKEGNSLESKIIDVMIKNNITMKESIEYLKNENKSLSKKELYNASLNLKDIMYKSEK